MLLIQLIGWQSDILHRLSHVSYFWNISCRLARAVCDFYSHILFIIFACSNLMARRKVIGIGLVRHHWLALKSTLAQSRRIDYPVFLNRESARSRSTFLRVVCGSLLKCIEPRCRLRLVDHGKLGIRRHKRLYLWINWCECLHFWYWINCFSLFHAKCIGRVGDCSQFSLGFYPLSFAR